MLKDKLKKALKKAGLNEALSELIGITSEDQIDEIVNRLATNRVSIDHNKLDFEHLLKSEAFESFVQENGLDKVLGFSQTLKSEYERKITKEIEAGLDNLLTKKEVNSQKEDNKSNSRNKDDIPKYAKAILERLEKIENSNKKSAFSEKVAEALKNSKLPEGLKSKWASRIVESDISIEKQIKSLEEEQQALYQSFAGEYAGSGLPSGGHSDKKVSEEQVNQLVEGLGI